MSFLNALTAGYSLEQVLEFIAKNYPQVGRKIREARNIGYDTQAILNIVKKLNPEVLQKAEKKGVYQRDNPYIDADQMTRSFSAYETAGKHAGPVAKTAAGFALSTMVPWGSILGTAQSVLQNQQPTSFPPQGQQQPPLQPNIPSGTQQSPSPTPSPMNQTPGQAIGAQVQAPGSIPNVPTPPMGQQAPTPPQINSQKIVKQMGLEGQIENMRNAGNDPEAIAAGVEASMRPEQKKWLQSQTQAPISEIIKDYLAKSPPESSKEPQQQQKETLEERLDQIKQKEQPKQEIEKIPFKDLKVKGIHLRIADENLRKNKPSITPNEPVEAELNIDTGEKTLVDGYHRYLAARGGSLDKAVKTNAEGSIDAKIKYVKNTSGPKGFGDEIREATQEEIEEYKNKQRMKVSEEFPHINQKESQKGDTVITDSGEIGTVKGISGHLALIEENGKLKQVPIESLRGQPEAIRNSKVIFDPSTISEEDRSAALGFVLPLPDKMSIIDIFHNGKPFLFKRKDGKPFDESIIRRIVDGTDIPLTKGDTFMGAYNPEKGDSRGSANHKELVSRAQKAGEPDDPTKDLIFEEIDDSFIHGYYKEFMNILRSFTKAYAAKPKNPKKGKA